MRHQPIYAPVPMLAADVSCFWALEQDQESYNREVYLPDAYVEVIINVGAPLLLESKHGLLELPRAFVNPLQNKPLRIRATGFCQMMSMQLYPWAVKPVLNRDADPSTVHVIGLDADWQRFARYLTGIVAHRGYGEAVACYQEYVCQTAYRRKHDLTLIRTAGHLLQSAHGQIRMADLAAQSHLSSSQFERQFKHYTAVSPKTYARIVRFGSLQAALLVNPFLPLADLADVYGYSDPAHLIREFKSFAHTTPRDFAATAPAFFELRQDETWCDFMKQSFSLPDAG
ncbi:MAG: AraC family transcriptional regulator [Chloroflexi bacterium]|nr:AraC family transcriptional regulator [Chloroflexota bacterium]MCC6892843.1 helix-turn-helix transcriptional regulator [Anaerolineae bacterium]